LQLLNLETEKMRDKLHRGVYQNLNADQINRDSNQFEDCLYLFHHRFP